MPRWELLDEESSSKDLAEFFEAPSPSTGLYGNVVLYDHKKPQPVVTFSAEGLTFAETETERTKHTTRGTSYTFNLVVPYGYAGAVPTITGLVISFQRSRMRGVGKPTEGSFYKLTLSVRRTDDV